MPRIAQYGPGIGEHWHDANYGPMGRLQPNDVALSPDLARRWGLSIGDTFPYRGQMYRYADHSYISPGHPNRNTIEFWVPPRGQTGAPLPAGSDPFQYSPPGQVSLPQDPFDFGGAMSSPPPMFDPAGFAGYQSPGFDLNQILSSPFDSLGDRPGFADLSSFTPPGSFSNPEPWNEQFSPIDAFGAWNPEPWNEQFSPVDYYSQQPLGTGGLDYEPFSPVDQYSQQPLDTSGLDYEPLSPVDTYSDQIPSSGEITDNPFADPFGGATADAEGQVVEDDPFAGATADAEGGVTSSPFEGAQVGGSGSYGPSGGGTAFSGFSGPAWQRSTAAQLGLGMPLSSSRSLTVGTGHAISAALAFGLGTNLGLSGPDPWNLQHGAAVNESAGTADDLKLQHSAAKAGMSVEDYQNLQAQQSAAQDAAAQQAMAGLGSPIDYRWHGAPGGGGFGQPKYTLHAGWDYAAGHVAGPAHGYWEPIWSANQQVLLDSIYGKDWKGAPMAFAPPAAQLPPNVIPFPTAGPLAQTGTTG